MLAVRVQRVVVTAAVRQLLNSAYHLNEPVRFIANRLNEGDDAEYQEKALEVRLDNHLNAGETALFLEVAIRDASDFSSTSVEVAGTRVGQHAILRATGNSVPNTIAAVPLHIRNKTGLPPHVYFEWSEKGPAANALHFLLSGGGDIPPLTHEILCVTERNSRKRPHVDWAGRTGSVCPACFLTVVFPSLTDRFLLGIKELRAIQ